MWCRVVRFESFDACAIVARKQFGDCMYAVTCMQSSRALDRKEWKLAR